MLLITVFCFIVCFWFWYKNSIFLLWIIFFRFNCCLCFLVIKRHISHYLHFPFLNFQIIHLSSDNITMLIMTGVDLFSSSSNLTVKMVCFINNNNSVTYEIRFLFLFLCSSNLTVKMVCFMNNNNSVT